MHGTVNGTVTPSSSFRERCYACTEKGAEAGRAANAGTKFLLAYGWWEQSKAASQCPLVFPPFFASMTRLKISQSGNHRFRRFEVFGRLSFPPQFGAMLFEVSHQKPVSNC